MEPKTLIKHILVVFAFIVVSYLLQTSVFSHLELAGVVPNLFIIVASSFGLIRGSKYGMIVGAFCGLVVDLYSGTYFGIYFLLFLYIGFLSGIFKQLFFGEDIKLPLLLIGVCDILYGIAVYIILFLSRGQLSFGYYLFSIIIPEAIYTVIVAILYYYLILCSNRWLDKDEQRRNSRLV